jgi:dihydroxyacetone kinase-like protein
MKKLINQPENVVREQLQGIALAHADLVCVNLDPAFIVRTDAPVRGKVAILSGGGSGHEPMHGGLVGPGMLDAACPGAIFLAQPFPGMSRSEIYAMRDQSGLPRAEFFAKFFQLEPNGERREV